MSDDDDAVVVDEALRARAAAGDAQAQWAMSRGLINALMDAAQAGQVSDQEVSARLREAMGWCRGAALQGLGDAQARLGVALLTAGFGEQRQLRHGYYWLYKATAHDRGLGFYAGLLFLPLMVAIVPVMNWYFPNRLSKIAYRKPNIWLERISWLGRWRQRWPFKRG